jgi:hypothetical protein
MINGLYAEVYCSKICELMYGEYHVKWRTLRCVVDQIG